MEKNELIFQPNFTGPQKYDRYSPEVVITANIFEIKLFNSFISKKYLGPKSAFNFFRF